jgi:hypothetical protein
MPILAWAESDPVEEYKRALWITLGATTRPQARALLRRELEQLNDVSDREGETTVGIRWEGDDGVGCQASAAPRSAYRCRHTAQWCVTLGQLQHFHLCADHALLLLQDARPFFSVRRIEDCRRGGRRPAPVLGTSPQREW